MRIARTVAAIRTLSEAAQRAQLDRILYALAVRLEAADTSIAASVAEQNKKDGRLSCRRHDLGARHAAAELAAARVRRRGEHVERERRVAHRHVVERHRETQLARDRKRPELDGHRVGRRRDRADVAPDDERVLVAILRVAVEDGRRERRVGAVRADGSCRREVDLERHRLADGARPPLRRVHDDVLRAAEP